MELHDLFPPATRRGSVPKKLAKLLTAEQALDLIHEETQFLAVFYASLSTGRPVSQADCDHAQKATGRIAFIHTAVKA